MCKFLSVTLSVAKGLGLGGTPTQMLRRCGWLSMTFSFERVYAGSNLKNMHAGLVTPNHSLRVLAVNHGRPGIMPV